MVYINSIYQKTGEIKQIFTEKSLKKPFNYNNKIIKITYIMELMIKLYYNE